MLLSIFLKLILVKQFFRYAKFSNIKMSSMKDVY